MSGTLAQEGGNAVSGAAGTGTITMPGAMTDGNIVIVCLEENDDATGPTLTATSVTFTRINRFVGDASHDNISLYKGVIGPGSDSTINIAAHLQLQNWCGIAAEITAVQQLVDGTPPTPTNVSSATPSVTSNTPTVSGDLAVAFCGHTDATAPTATPSGWTTLTRRAATNSIEGAWLALPDANAVTPQWTFAVSKFALLEAALVLPLAGSSLETLSMQSAFDPFGFGPF